MSKDRRFQIKATREHGVHRRRFTGHVQLATIPDPDISEGHLGTSSRCQVGGLSWVDRLSSAS